MKFINKVKISKTKDFKIPLKNKDYQCLKSIQYKDFNLKTFFGNLQHLRLEHLGIKKKDIAKTIMKIFLHKEIRSGPKKFIKAGGKEILNTINNYIEKGLPIEFTLLGFPFKAANPLKTTRQMPDLGELGFILRLFDITKLIQSIYSPGAKFVILDEGLAFYDFFGIPKTEAISFREELIRWNKILGIQEIISLKCLVNSLHILPEFKPTYQKNLEIVKNQAKKEEKETLQKIQEIVPTIFTSINTRNCPLDDLFLIYSFKIKKNALPRRIQKIREKLFEKAKKTAICYIAFHKTRYDIKSMDMLFPNAIRCTVAPKPKSLGILGINKNTKLLPHHGVGVLTKDNNVTVEYEADIKRTREYRAIFIKNEASPFYYKKI